MSASAGLFPQTPILIGGIDQRLLPTLSLTSNDTAVVAQLDVAACFEILWQLFPRHHQPRDGNGRFTPGKAVGGRVSTSFSAIHQPPADCLAQRVVLPGNVPARGEPAASLRYRLRVVVGGCRWCALRTDAGVGAFVQRSQCTRLRHGRRRTRPRDRRGEPDFRQGAGLETARLAARVLRGESPGSIAPSVVGCRAANI